MNPVFTPTNDPLATSSATAAAFLSDQYSWDIENNLEAQKLLAAAIAQNDQYHRLNEEDAKRKLDSLEDVVQQTPQKASHNLNVSSVPHLDLAQEGQSNSQQTHSAQAQTISSAEPQKKKPGRKPLTTTPSSKRKAQNRAAQRAFRERKERYVKELEDRIRQLETQSAKNTQENEQLKALVEQLQSENFVLKHANFAFDFSLDKPTESAIELNKNINEIVGIPTSASPVLPLETVTPPSSTVSDEEPSSPSRNNKETPDRNTVPASESLDMLSVLDSHSQVVPLLFDYQNSQPTVAPQAVAQLQSQSQSRSQSQPTQPQSSTSKPTLRSSESGQTPKPQTASEFCQKLTDGVCPDDPDEEPNIPPAQSSGSTSFSEYRDPTPFTAVIDNPFSETAAIPPLFEENFEDFGSYAPMQTPGTERNNPLTEGRRHGFATIEEIRDKKFLSCNKVWERIQQHPRFDDLEADEMDELCRELKAKARCSGHGPVVPEEEVDAALVKLEELR